MNYRLLKQTLAGFFQDRKVKVSLFLQDGTQHSDGSIAVPLGGELGFNVLPPGTVIYLQQDCREERLDVVGAGCWMINEERITRTCMPNSDSIGRGGNPQRRTTLGSNLYNRDRSKLGKKTPTGSMALGGVGDGSKGGTSSTNLGGGPGLGGPGNTGSNNNSGDFPKTADAKIVGELNALASMMSVRPTETGEDVLRLDNMFGGILL